MALRAGQGTIAARLLKRAATDARDDCEGRYYLYSGTTLVARGRRTLEPGQRGSVTHKLTSAGKRLLKRRSSLKVRASVLTNGQGSDSLGTYRLKR